jgi:hypothetical protein
MKRSVVITEELVHDAVNYLTTQSGAAADAKANVVRGEYHRNNLRARLILDAPHTTAELRKAWAEAHEDYAEICEKLAVAERDLAWHYNQRNRATAICEMWRTEQATLRGLQKF